MKKNKGGMLLDGYFEKVKFEQNANIWRRMGSIPSFRTTNTHENICLGKHS